MPALRITGTNFSLTSASLPQMRAGDDAALAVEVLGARVDDQVGAVARPAAAAPASRSSCRPPASAPASCAIVGQRADVADLGQRIGRRLGEQQLRVRLHRARARRRRRSARRSSSRRRTCANSRPNSMIVEPNTLCEQITWSPAFSRPMPSSRIALMPLDGADAGLGAFERGQAALHHRHRRVGEARVDERLFLVGEARRRGGGVGLHEAAGEEQRLRVLAPRRSAAGLRAPRACRAAAPARQRRRAGSSCRRPSGCLASALCSARRERSRVVFVVALRRGAAPPSRRSRRR